MPAIADAGTHRHARRAQPTGAGFRRASPRAAGPSRSRRSASSGTRRPTRKATCSPTPTGGRACRRRAGRSAAADACRRRSCRCARRVVLHSDPARFGLLYRLLWRLAHEPGLRHDPLDADRCAAQQHGAGGAARHAQDEGLRPLSRRSTRTPTTAPLHVAWFEPEHHIVEAAAPFFARRFAQMRWAILTPERSVRWDGEALALRPRRAARRGAAAPTPAKRSGSPTTGSIFNPARLKLAMMQKEMPRKLLAQPARGAADRSAGARGRRAQHAHDRRARHRCRRAASRHDRAACEADAMHDPPKPRPCGRSAAQRWPALREATDRCRECPIGEHATQSVSGEGPDAARADVRRRAARRPGRPAGPALRRPGRPAVRPRARRARHGRATAST